MYRAARTVLRRDLGIEPQDELQELHRAMLRGETGPPLSSLEAVTRLLRALGIEPGRKPLALDEVTALYRSVLTGRRMLLVLDNAASAEQVRHLLPGGGGSTVVVTSRSPLDELVAQFAATQRTVEPMPSADAVSLVERILGTDRVGPEPGPVVAMAAACGHLPLALCLAVADLAQHPTRTIAAHVASMSNGNRSAAVPREAGEPSSVGVAIDLSYGALSPADRRTQCVLRDRDGNRSRRS